MNPAPRRLLRRISVAGQWALLVLCVAWVLCERPAPFVNIRWRDGLSIEARRQAEARLYLEAGELIDGAWRYELASPRSADIAAIIGHPDVEDTHRIDRTLAAIAPDTGHGRLRVWWAGPFKGARSRGQSRILFLVLGIVTVVCAALADDRSPRSFLRRVGTFWS
jgi:hypothetical protein